MNHRAKSIIKKTIGIVLIVFGLVGLIMPILPGWLVIAVGLELLGLKFLFHNKIHSLWRRMKNLGDDEFK